jgi:putative ABC transport system permease protein
VLKGSTTTGKSGGGDWLRKGLVVVQFALSALLIVSTIVSVHPSAIPLNKDLGFYKEEIMFFPMQGDKMFKEL